MTTQEHAEVEKLLPIYRKLITKNIQIALNQRHAMTDVAKAAYNQVLRERGAKERW